MAAALMLGGAVAAQDIVFDKEPLEACMDALEGRDARRACVGRAADACIDSQGGDTTVGMRFCWGAEAAIWDARLNVVFRDLMTIESEVMADMREIGATVPDSAAALRDMQRAWIRYRDTACLYEHSTWGGGTGGGPAQAACVAQVTAAQTLWLEEQLEDRQR